MLNPDFQPCPPFQSALTEEFTKWVWLGLKTVTIVEMMVKIQKRTTNSRKIHIPGGVDGVDGKTSPAQEEANKVRPKICNTSNLYI